MGHKKNTFSPIGTALALQYPRQRQPPALRPPRQDRYGAFRATACEKWRDTLVARSRWATAEAATALYVNGVFSGLLAPGRHAFWSGRDEIAFKSVDVREQTLDIAGQDLLTADKLTVRLNAILTYRTVDIEKRLTVAADVRQSLYREAQLVLRTAVGGRDLDGLMNDKDALTGEIEAAIGAKAAAYGLELVSFGVRDIILPGDIKNILIQATEAKKASEAATIVRREETAAMRHQLNTARILADNPVLMRLRELETLEKVASGNKLKVILGDKGLTEKVTSLL